MSPTAGIPCNICGTSEFEVLFAPGVAQLNQIVQCKCCGLVYAAPRRRVDCEKLAAMEEEWDLAELNPQRFEKERLQVRDYADARRLLGRLHPRKGKVIEIGSSCGFHLAEFRADGWDVLGIEPDKNVARRAVEQLSIPTVVSTVEEAGITDESADVVVMLHVIEHVPDPVGTLREIYRILRPKGHLLLETPRYDTLMYRLFGRRERSLSCDGHIYFFTTASLQRAYSLVGFQLEKIEYVGRSMTLDRFAYNVGVMAKNTSVQGVLGSLSRRLGLNRLAVSVNVRDMQRVILRKPTSNGLIGQC